MSKPKINFSSSAPPPPPPARSGFFFSSDEIINGCCYIRHLAVGYLPCYFCHSRFVLSSVESPLFLILIIIFGLLSFLSGAIALHQCHSAVCCWCCCCSVLSMGWKLKQIKLKRAGALMENATDWPKRDLYSVGGPCFPLPLCLGPLGNLNWSLLRDLNKIPIILHIY